MKYTKLVGEVEVSMTPAEKIEAIKEKWAEAWKELRAIEDPFSPEGKLLNETIFKLQADKKAAEAEIATAARHEELQLKRNERIRLLDNVLEAHAKVVHSIGDKKITIDEKNALNDAFVAAKDIVINELLAKYSAPAKTASVSTGEVKTGTKSATILEMMIAGNTYDEMIAAGMADGTIRSVANSEKFSKQSDGTYVKK